MKKLLFLASMMALLTVFNGCQKEEPVVSQLTDGSATPLLAAKPDVYVENGYLVFKDLNAVNSAVKSLNEMSSEQVDVFEKQHGFESARTYFSKIFKESEQITTVEGIVSFKEKYKNILKWSEIDPEDYSFDYPFYFTNFVPVINKDGLIKIGKSLFKYNKENRITLIDGDFTKLEAAMKLDRNTKNVLILGKRGELKATSLTGLTGFEGQYGANNSGDNNEWCKWGDNRRMKTGLQFENFTYLDNNYITYSGGYNIYLWQRGQKRVLGIWWNYSVKYRNGSVVYKENGLTKFAMPGYTTSPSTQSTQYTIYTNMTLLNQPVEPPLSAIPIPQPMYFTCFTTNEDIGNFYPFTVVYTN